MVSGPEGGVVAAAETDPVTPAQSKATFAYARTLLEADVADAAASDALSAFRQALAARTNPAAGPQPIPGDETLLALTRLMTAVSVPDHSSPADRRQAVWASIGHTSHCTCRESAALLATRANGNIQPRESTALDEHLASCAGCRELSIRAAEAEAAFRRELAPATRGIGGLPSVPPTAFGALGVLIAIVVGAIVLLGGGSKANTSRAAIAPVQTQASAQLRVAAASHPAARKPKRTAPSVHQQKAVRKQVAHHHAVKPKTAAAVTTASTPTPTTPTITPAAGNTGAAPATAVTSATSQPPAGTTPPPSTAAEVSGSPSLPADSAPQQGIGSPTSTTP